MPNNFSIGGNLCEVDCDHCGGTGKIEKEAVKRCGLGTKKKKETVTYQCGKCHGHRKFLTPFGKELVEFLSRHMAVYHNNIDRSTRHSIGSREK